VKRISILGHGIAAAALLALCGHAVAGNFSYSYLEGGLLRTSFDEDVVIAGVAYSDVGGAYFAGSYQFTDHLALGLSANGQTNSGHGTELNSSAAALWASFIAPVGGFTDLSLQFGFVSGEAEACVYSFCVKADDTGVAFGAGLRHWATPSVEVNTAVTHVSWDEFDDETIFGIGAAFWFAGHSSIRLGLSFSDDASTFSLGYRYTFGR
jgi:hypothetical protein